MTRPSDRSPEMISGTRLDAAIEQALHGAAASDDLAPFAGFVDDLRAMADRPAPEPSVELAALLVGHNAPVPETYAKVSTLQPRRPHHLDAGATRQPSRRPRVAAVRGRVAALGFAGKATMVAALATTAVTGAAAAGILPDPAIHFLRQAIEVVTPFELPATGQGAHQGDATEGAAAGKPGHADPPATDPQPAPTVPDAGATGTPALDGGPIADATPPSGSSSATATASTIASHSDVGARIPDATASPAPERSDEPSKPADPAPNDGHIPPGQAPDGAPHPGGGSPGDAPRGDADAAPGPLSAPNGDPPGPASPRRSRSAPDRPGPHHGRQGGPGAVQDPHDQPPSNVPDEPRRPGPAPDGERGRSPQSPTGQDPAAPADDRRGAQHREDPPAPGDEAAHHAGGRPERDTGSPLATGAPGSAMPPPSA